MWKQCSLRNELSDGKLKNRFQMEHIGTDKTAIIGPSQKNLVKSMVSLIWSFLWY